MLSLSKETVSLCNWDVWNSWFKPIFSVHPYSASVHVWALSSFCTWGSVFPNLIDSGFQISFLMLLWNDAFHFSALSLHQQTVSRGYLARWYTVPIWKCSARTAADYCQPTSYAHLPDLACNKFTPICPTLALVFMLAFSDLDFPYILALCRSWTSLDNFKDDLHRATLVLIWSWPPDESWYSFSILLCFALHQHLREISAACLHRKRSVCST